MNQPKRIFVIGHMGAGRFVFTEALAKKLSWEIVDANPSMERYIGRLAREIMGEQGEAAFNSCQAEIINHCRAKENIVVLLEECVVSSAKCRALLSAEYVVYLKVSIETQLDRMRGGRVSALPVEDMRKFLQKQHDERDAYYEEIATLVVDSEDCPDSTAEVDILIEKDVNKVIQALGK